MLNLLFKFSLLFFAASGISSPFLASDSFGPYQGKILNVEEADTIYTEIEIWPNLFQRVYIRIRDIDSAEPGRIKGGRAVSVCEKKAAQKAIGFVNNFIANTSTITISKVSQIKSTANYIFARISVDGKDLGEALVNSKHAISVTGLKRKRWSCRNI